MKINTLVNQLAKSGSQYKLAKDLEVTAGSLNQALSKERNIFIVDDGGRLSAFEIKAVFNTSPNLEAVKKMIRS